jgi:hypothetical protein
MDKNPGTATVKTPSSNFTGDGEATTWLEPVTDEQYLAAHSTAGV